MWGVVARPLQTLQRQSRLRRLSFRLLAWRAFCQDGLWEKRYEFIWALDSDIDLSKAGRDIKQNVPQIAVRSYREK